MIRPSTLILGLALGTSDVHPVGQLVTIGGETWDQPGTATYYRDPSLAVPHGPPRRSQDTPTSNTPDRLHEAAHLLRSAAWHLDHARKSGDAAEAESAQRTIQQSLDLLHN
jgi:hypothetical protein